VKGNQYKSDLGNELAS